MNDDLFEMRSGVDPSRIKEVHKETHISTLVRGIAGCAIAYAALNGRKYTELHESMRNLTQEITTIWEKSPDKTRKHLREVTEKYVFITPPKPPN